MALSTKIKKKIIATVIIIIVSDKLRRWARQ